MEDMREHEKNSDKGGDDQRPRFRQMRAFSVNAENEGFSTACPMYSE